MVKRTAIVVTIMAALALAASAWAKAPIARVKAKKLQDKTALQKTIKAPLAGVINVAVYDDEEYGPGEYFDGGDSNSYGNYQYILNSDPQGRFNAVVVTDLFASTLAPYDVLTLPDNSVPEEFLSDVATWFTSGKVIVCADSAVCYAAYSGLFWPGITGDVGNGYLWDYGSCYYDGRIALINYITEGYTVGDIIMTQSGDAQYYPWMLPLDAVVFLEADTCYPGGGDLGHVEAGRKLNEAHRSSKKANGVLEYGDTLYGVYRDIPGHGRMVLLGPYDTPGEIGEGAAVQPPYIEDDSWPMIRGAHLLPGNAGVDLNFYDDISGAAQFCVNTGSGIYEWDNYDWYYFYDGRAEIINAGAAVWNGPTDPNFLYVVYNPVQLNAYGYFYDTENGIFSSLIDYDTTDSPFPCGGEQIPR